MLRNLLLFIVLALQSGLLGQTVIKGRVSDAQTREPLPGVHISRGQNQGTVTNDQGFFEISSKEKISELVFSFIGYETLTHPVNPENPETFIEINLKPEAVVLEEIDILSGLALARYNPISFQSIEKEEIIFELGDKPLPEVMQLTPGLFAHREGGGSGDATVRIRGFEQENIAVLLNGIPINGAENGLVYWNNWMGLAEVASSVQVQRGIGASNVALNSVGGTINIVTAGSMASEKTSLHFQTTSYGNTKSTISHQSGMLSHGWSFSLLGSRTKGDGYIPGTYVDGWAYFLSINKEISPQQRMTLTVLGGPETHGQRNFKLTSAETKQFGFDYNKEWGELNGAVKNSSENFYHKPHLSVNHYLSLDKGGLLATAIYVSPGKGGGKWSDNFGYDANLFSFRDASGQLDWEAVYAYNQSNADTFALADGTLASGYSKVVQTNYLADHMWAGIISNLELPLGQHLSLISGFHYRYFSSTLRQEVADLLGGKYYLDDYSWSLAGVAGRNQIRHVGDVVRVNSGALLHQTTLFAQLAYERERINMFAAMSVSDNRYRRQDSYNYPTDKWSKWVNRTGFDAKTGLSFRVDESQQLYLNAAYFNKAPYFKYVFGNYNNNPSSAIGNEQVKTAEVGYLFTDNHLSLNLATYYTFWKDVAFLSNEYIQLENNTQTRAMVSGLNALHQGLEFNLEWQSTNRITLKGMASLGNWKWQNNVHAVLFNERDVAVDTVNVYAKGLYVGGQPQLQVGIAAESTLFQQLVLDLELFYNDRQYAHFDPSGRQDAKDQNQPYRIPSATLINAGFKLPISLSGFQLTFYGKLNNALNLRYITNGEDGFMHDSETFSGFWSFGRTFDAGILMIF